MELYKKEVEDAGIRGGIFLDKLGKYDVRTLTKEEWEEFINSIFFDPCVPF